ncbi:MAG: hypothetical protein QOD71_534 [Thermoleophilaceae bacterium]|nr:hypothetical protein [Thermoleophilaceae bacterium]
MSLYRQTGRTTMRTLAMVATAGLVIGVIVGLAIGRSTAPDPTLGDKLSDLRADLAPARQGIELTATEYAQAVRDGRVIAPTEYQAAQQDARRALDAVHAVRDDLRALDAARARAIERSIDALAAAVARRADPGEVERLSKGADVAVSEAIGR